MDWPRTLGVAVVRCQGARGGLRMPTMTNALLTCAQMKAVDHLTMQAGIGGAALMENAGRAVAGEITSRYAPCPAVVLCGPGNNGGDGFVVARHLVKAGWRVSVGVHGDMARASPEARHHAGLWRGGVRACEPGVLAGAEMVVDAVFGAGLGRAPDPVVQETLRAAAASRAVLVAVDVPSGLCGDTGADLGASPCALTVTFFRKKPGHLLLPGRALCGETVVAEIGMAPAVLQEITPACFENGPPVWLADWPRARPDGNKFGRGHALVVGGAVMTGAARMAARAAARAGAGLTSVAVPEASWAVYAAALTSIMVRKLAAESDLQALLDDTRINAMLIGPGAGISGRTRAQVLAMLATGRPVVLDADALSVFQPDPAALFDAIRGPCVMTPHEGEFGRLFRLEGDKLERARQAARLSGAVVVLKGQDTVIAAPDGLACINSNAPETLATAGAGDVLGGFILGLLAQGMAVFPAACAGVWLHGAAAGAFGPGLLAEDLPDLLPGVLRGLSSASV